MAGDLIPPPSPAGRPSGDAAAERERAREREEARKRRPGLWHEPREEAPDGEAFHSAEDEATHLRPGAAMAMADPEGASVPALAEADRAQPKVPSPHRSRFGLLLGALIGIAIAAAAIGAALYVSGGGGNGASDGWSAWKPNADQGVGAAKQIANHVGHKYRLADGDQLVGVQAGPLEVFDVPLEVAMRTATQGGNIEFIEGNGLLYTLNGLGPKGSIESGKPSEKRHLLLRREALELALYTFRYIKGVDLVVTLMPPAPPKKAKKGSTAAAATATDTPMQALFYRPGDLEPQLDIPLGATIPKRTPRPETLPGTEARRIDALTRGNLFLASFQQGQDQKAFLVLDRLPG
jgi:hypothetical protein